MKKPSSFTLEWVTARCFNFPATIKVSRQRFAWAAIYRADLSTKDSREAILKAAEKPDTHCGAQQFRSMIGSGHEQTYFIKRIRGLQATRRQKPKDRMIMGTKLITGDGFTKMPGLATERDQGSRT